MKKRTDPSFPEPSETPGSTIEAPFPTRRSALGPGHRPRPSGKAIEITADFRAALDLFADPDRAVFVTGRAGTGKSTLLHYFKENTERELVVLAPTGIAALNVGGQTLHSFFGLPHHFIDIRQVKKARRYKRVIERLDCLVIDEISMVRADVFDAVDQALRLTRGSAAPFGGVKVILFGDVFQLPPVVERDLETLFSDRYSGPFFFDSAAWRALNPATLELRKAFRQGTDPFFLNILNRVRDQSATADDLVQLNQRFTAETGEKTPHIVLTATNNVARDINDRQLQHLKGKSRSYEARVDGDFDAAGYPTDAALVLKKGAQVLMIRNDADKRWVNGDIGEVLELEDDRIHVQIKGATVEVTPVLWEKYVYAVDAKTGEIKPDVVGTFEQLPVKLAWAITIHKSQGQTYDHVAIDLGHGAFAHGQTYVALSRCTTLKGITLRRPIRERDIICHERVKSFHAGIRETG